MSKNTSRDWIDVKKMGGLTTDPTSTHMALFSADQLNTFFSRFEKDSTEPHKLASNNKADGSQIKPLIADHSETVDKPKRQKRSKTRQVQNNSQSHQNMLKPACTDHHTSL